VKVGVDPMVEPAIGLEELSRYVDTGDVNVGGEGDIRA
jgi:hypothetical protein